MTKAEATKRAKYALSRGHYRPGVGANPIPGTGSLVYVECPLCSQRVSYYGMAWDSGAKLQQGLRNELVEHLREDH